MPERARTLVENVPGSDHGLLTHVDLERTRLLHAFDATEHKGEHIENAGDFFALYGDMTAPFDSRELSVCHPHFATVITFHIALP